MKKETWPQTAQGRTWGEARFTTWELRTEWGLCVGQATWGVIAWPQPTVTSPMLVRLPDPCSPRRPFRGPTPGPRGQAEGVSENSTSCTCILCDTYE